MSFFGLANQSRAEDDADADLDYDSEGSSLVEAPESGEVVLEGAPIAAGALDGFLQRGRCIKAQLHPCLDAGFSYISSTGAKDAASFLPDEAQAFRFSAARSGSVAVDFVHLADNCSDAFDELAFAYNDDPDADVVELVGKASKSYRDAYELALQVISAREDLDAQDELEYGAINDMSSVLMCAEAIYLTGRDSSLSDSLMMWLNRSDPRPATAEGEDVMSSRAPYLHPGFWDYVYKGILRGLSSMVGACLDASGLLDIDMPTAQAVRDLSLLLQTWPRIGTYPGNARDYAARYKQWRTKVIAFGKNIRLPDSELEAAFSLAGQLLRGDKEVVLRYSETWQEAVAALALLFDPVGTKAPKDVRALYEMVTQDDEMALMVDTTLPSEAACAALCIGNGPKAVRETKDVDELGAALLADMLEKIEILEDVRSADDLTIRDILVLGAGDKLIGMQGGWKAAVLLWKTVADAGVDRIALILPRLRFHNFDDVGYVLWLCDDLGLDEESRDIETVWARSRESAQQHYEAALSYDRADQPQLLDRLNWTLFTSALITGEPSADPQLAAALEAPTEVASRALATLLAPYATLSTFIRLKSVGDRHGAARHLAALLRFPELPKKYVAVLMAEILPLVLNVKGPPSFSRRDLFDSLAAIEEYYDSDTQVEATKLLAEAMATPARTASSGIVDWRALVQPEQFTPDEVLALVRLHLARAIATSFVQ